MLALYKSIINNRHALKALTSVELKTSVATTRFGIFWWILDPLIMMMIYYFVFSVVLSRGEPGYHLFVLCGIISWGFFSSALAGSAGSILSNKSLILQINVPLSILILVQPLVRLLLAHIGIVMIVVWNYHFAGFHTFAVFPLLLAIALFAYGIGLFFAVINIYFTDMSNIIKYMLRAGFFLSPVLFPASRIMESEKIPELFKTLYGLNPMAWIMTAIRSILLEGSMFAWSEYFLFVLAIFVLIQIGLIWLRMNTPRIVRML